MRLIDADELIEHAWRDKLDSRELIVEMIENAPTIKEIPTKIPIDVFEKLISQEPTTMIDKSNFSQEQYKADLQSAYDCGLRALKQEPRWIPVSERLPRFAGVYRVTRHYPKNVMNPDYLVDACCFDGSNWHDDNRINPERHYADNVIAWQENPEPYKGESQESEEVNE